ncbi:DUF2062 domain-containing protein [Verrucomicrobiaceae bacterium R5-34]|uniref:DUF2062 domain-containing protein n=1 Tax=Oceaniferula flava TaxID=2800421 RepID=A0AAE2SBK0_9BACT|nr:DUF2062 domain-containing protein [Oceaniferula flavus]MBK1829228.1 DUF2062 domain-containing protein [Verrucomicrobiaceae bacterium R5-34]MBK1853465.1 DUF2062 domain-containing protein [Oceaniferula flavus]MBM1134770.1 DUF2062 domain-containing protein [Oceaniferula flavus]
MKQKYLRLVRKAYRYLRHPRIRSRPWLVALTKPLFDRALWRPCRRTVAGGLSIGLFCAMLPIPFQMLVAALACMRSRVNIPVSMAACWISNPFTYPPLILLQIKFGSWLHDHMNIPLPFSKETRIPFPGLDIVGSPANFTVGFIAMGIILSLLAYPLVYGISLFLPNQGRAVISLKKKAGNASHSPSPHRKARPNVEPRRPLGK